MIKTRAEALRALGLGPDAGEQQIKAVYKDLVKKCHPDVTGRDDASLYNRITEAYQFLINDSKGRVLTHSRVVGKSSTKKPASKADYAAFQKKAAKQKERRAQEFEEKQREFSAMYEKQEADYKRAMEAIDAIRVARAIESMVWANGLGKESNNDTNEE
ncbi:DnaJ domain [Butyrivibrio fibrisolvens 16/4]|jgi:curved DNA-binding protein CbpA|nr:DnaJ domain [Butyrivibrio fibrisolvens 16/4]